MNEIFVGTQVYNTPINYVITCIESVLNQSYRHFQYFLIDNGCNDECSNVLREYSKKDKRIRLIRFDENIVVSHHLRAFQAAVEFDYCTILDSDDWWEPDYLDRLVILSESTGADIICTGKQIHEEWSGRIPLVKMPQQFIFDRSMFSVYFPLYRTLFSSVWGKFLHRNVIKAMNLPFWEKYRLMNGFDYLLNIEWLRHAKRICLDDSVLYHYRLRKNSVFHSYDPARIESNRIVYDQWREFLSSFGPISRENEHHLACLSATLCQLTLNVISMSEMDSMQKFEEYRRLLLEEQNRDLSRWKHPYIRKRLKKVLNDLLQSGEELFKRQAGKDADELFGEVMELFAPRCGRAVPLALCPLLRQDDAMADAVLYDDANRLMERTVSLIAEHQEPEQLIPVILRLTEAHPTMHGIADPEFISAYPDIYLALWREDYARAEEAMDSLLEKHSIRNQTFLELYLSLAAVNKNFAKYIKAEQYREHLRLDDNESFTS